MITNIKKSIMGTIQFDGKFGKMRKSQSFITYPINKDSDLNILCVQSEHRWVEIDLNAKTITLSTHRVNYANSMTLTMDKITNKHQVLDFNDDYIKPLIDAIRGTASAKCTNNVLALCDNSNANLI